MEEINALRIRNHLGEVLDRLTRTGEPILVSKGRKVRAVLVTPEDFKTRFLDYRTKEEQDRRLEEIRALRSPRKEEADSLELLRQLRGYDR